LADGKQGFWFKFWGTRGSLPAPRPTTNRYGGNTPCVEVRAGRHLIILDAGSGIRALGVNLQKEFPRGGLRAALLFSHYHWDHIHGFPFFGPAYHPRNQFTIYGGPRGSRNVKDILAGQMAMPYFPVPIEVMQARFDFRDVRPRDRFRIGPLLVTTEALNHPGRCLSYRISLGKRSLVYATDTEHGGSLDLRLVEHARGADVLIYDAAYTEVELRRGKKGYGHSTWREGVKVARAAGVKRLFLFHHEPNRDDRALATMERAARRQFRNCSAAREKRTYRL